MWKLLKMLKTNVTFVCFYNHALYNCTPTQTKKSLFPQVGPSRYDDPFVFATFRSLCAWLAEETSCLKEEVMALLPFLIGYTRSHLQDKNGKGLADWMSKMSVTDGSAAEKWTGKHVLRSEISLNCELLYRKSGLCSHQATSIIRYL